LTTLLSIISNAQIVYSFWSQIVQVQMPFAVSSQPPSTQICAFSMQFAVSSQSPSIQICGFCNT
jgi:hypothetical protein